MLVLTFSLACAPAPDGVVRTPGPSWSQDAASPSDTGPRGARSDSADPETDPSSPETDPSDDETLLAGPCPAQMALVVHTTDFCVDRYEAHLEGWSPYEVPASGVAAVDPGVVPQGYISGVVAQAACEAAGKRLCELDEWMRACQGPSGWTYPYGNTFDADACNVTRDQHPIVSLFGAAADWSSAQMNDPRVNQQPDTVDPGGANPGCVSAEGVYDLHGNLHEWIADPNGTFKGGFFMDAVINGAGCTYTTTAHSFGYHDYSTGFRCCADPQ